MQIKIEQIIQTNRKTISIEVVENQKIRIKAPVKLSEYEIENIIKKHNRWIQKRFDYYKKINIKPKLFAEGEKFLFLGYQYTLKFDTSAKQPIILNNQILISPAAEQQWRKIFEDWYKKNAIEEFKKRAYIYAKLLGVKYKKIKISSAKHRWGSCSSKAYININWRLIMAPMPVIDYVIVHELAHLIEPNHSKNFWLIVQKIIPQYKKDKLWLKENAHSLFI